MVHLWKVSACMYSGLLSELTMVAYLPLKFFHQFIIFSFLLFKIKQHLTASAKHFYYWTAFLLLLDVHAQENHYQEQALHYIINKVIFLCMTFNLFI